MLSGKSDEDPILGVMSDTFFRPPRESISHLAPRPGSSLDHPASQLSAFRGVAVSCHVDVYLLRRDCFTAAMRFVSIPAKAVPYFRIATAWELAWPNHCTRMGRVLHEAPPGLGSKWIQYQDEAGCPERIMHIMEKFRHTLKPFSPNASFIPFKVFCAQDHFFRAWTYW